MQKEEKVKLLRITFLFASVIFCVIGIRGLMSHPEWLAFMHLGFGIMFAGYLFEPDFFLGKPELKEGESEHIEAVIFKKKID